jgi:hypothetical protein
VVDPTPEELEKLSFLDVETLARARSKRRLQSVGLVNSVGHGVDVGHFLTDSDPVGVPQVVIRYLAEQLGIAERYRCCCGVVMTFRERRRVA